MNAVGDGFDDGVGGVTVLQGGAHLVGSVPLADAAEVFNVTAGVLGDRLRRLSDGETGPRTDWIVWQYPVFSSQPEFEVCPPRGGGYRALPQLRLKQGARADDLTFGALGYAQSAIASYGVFAHLKRDGRIPVGCRFQVSLPTPLAPISAFVDSEHRAVVEPVYEAHLVEELKAIVAAIPPDQLALQWDTNFEFGMLEGHVDTWFPDVRAGVLERLLRLSRYVPRDVELGYHLCYGDEGHRHGPAPADARRLVEIANALCGSMSRPLNWLHLPVPRDADDAYFVPFGGLRLNPDTELYLGVVHLEDGPDGVERLAAAARRFVPDFGVATECGWGRMGSAAVPALCELLHVASSPVLTPRSAVPQFVWPDDFERVIDDEWTHAALDRSGLTYDKLEHHEWYRNMDPTIEQLGAILTDGDILLDYSGGTGILFDLLRLRVFDRNVGYLVVDSSAKYLRVALEKWRDDPAIAVRLMRYLKDEKRLQSLSEVLSPGLVQRGVDAIVSANAVHLYPDLAQVASGWVDVLRPGGTLLINSGNIRNPRARPGEWILDETVWVINDLAQGLVLNDTRYAKYRSAVEDRERMYRHATFRDRVFLQPRPLEHYLGALRDAGFTDLDVRERTITARVEEWYEFLTAYHDAVLGWVGGTQRVDGQPASPEAVEDRLALMRHGIETIFNGRSTFAACWTYITARAPQGVSVSTATLEAAPVGS